MNTVVVNGTFDIIHPGHLALLNYARGLGDRLIVAIDSDDRVRKLKGPGRPINTAFERRLLLQNLRAVDEVRLFQTDQELVDIIKGCSMMVKGSDYRDRHIIGSDVIPNIVFFERMHEYSTTNKIQDIINR